MHRKKDIAIVVVSVIVIGIALGLALHVSRILSESRAVEISKQSPVVQDFLSRYPSVEYRVTTGTRSIAGKNYNCWVVIWKQKTSPIPHSVHVYVDKDSSEIIGIRELS